MKRSTAFVLTPVLLLPCGLLALIEGASAQGKPAEATTRPVYLAGDLSPEHLIALTETLRGVRHVFRKSRETEWVVTEPRYFRWRHGGGQFIARIGEDSGKIG